MDNLILKILKVFEKNNLFEEGVELIGSWFFYLYQRHLNAPSFPLRTQDIDFLIHNPSNFCLHKLVISQRRREKEKLLKDLQQAICRYSIADKEHLKKPFLRYKSINNI